MSARYEFIDHTADIGIRVEADSREELFAEAMRAMFDFAVVAQEGGNERMALSVSADSLAELLREFLGDLLYHFITKGFISQSVTFNVLTDTKLAANVKGCLFNAAKHTLRTELKAVTYHQLQVVCDGGRWHAQVILDV